MQHFLQTPKVQETQGHLKHILIELYIFLSTDTDSIHDEAQVFTKTKQRCVEKWIYDNNYKTDKCEDLINRLKDFDSISSAIDLW